MTSTAVDGFLIPHRKNEVPDDLVAQQLGDQLSGRFSSDRVPDVKKWKKGERKDGFHLILLLPIDFRTTSYNLNLALNPLNRCLPICNRHAEC